MQYRSFGQLDWQTSALGFGCMRLPTADGQPMSPEIDQPAAIGLLRHAIDAGVNYVDTAYGYHRGNSEPVVGEALRDGYRDRVHLATKLPVWLVKEPADFDRILGEQLTRLQTDHLDCYLLHALTGPRWRDIVLRHGLLDLAQAALADGRIRHLGFSFHDNHEVFETIVEGYDWDFCQIQYNYMDIDHQAGTRGLALAASRGLGVVIMEPLLGGRLADPPADVREALDQAPVRRSPVDWALDWLWDQPAVSVVLSGMSTLEQVQQNLAAADRSRVGCLSAAEQAVIAAARDRYRARTAVPCTGCEYCMPCPHGVNIPANFEFFNHAHLFDDVARARVGYNIILAEDQRAASCVACDECLEKCPQDIPISNWMPKVDALLAQPAP